MAKNSNIVVYKNEFNTVPLRSFNAVEMDLLMTIMSLMREQGLTEIKYSFEELKELSRYNKETAIDGFIADLESTYSKLINLNVRFETQSEIVRFVFFTRYSINKDERTISIRVNEEFAPLINKMTGEFTRFELQQFTDLKSSYSKTAYRLLKQYRSTGVVRFSIDEFKRLFDVPPSYEICHITERILKPIQKELSPVFKNLEIIKHKKRRRVVGLEFTFLPINETQKQATKPTSKRKKDFEEREYGEGELTRMGESNWQKKLDEINRFCEENQVDLLENTQKER